MKRASPHSAVIRVQESKLREGVTFGPQRGYKAKLQGAPEFCVLLHFYVTISKISPILKSLRGGGGGGHPPFGHVCVQLASPQFKTRHVSFQKSFAQ